MRQFAPLATLTTKSSPAISCGALESLQLLETLSDEKFGREAPSFANLRAALEELQDIRKAVSSAATEGRETEAAGRGRNRMKSPAILVRLPVPAPPQAKKRSGSVAAEPADRDDAMQRLTLVAHFLRHESPLNPVPYLLLRAMRWGELRAAGASLNPALLEAPPTEKRTLIKKMSMEGNWAEVLENAEQAMSLPCGRGWLDLQRYAVRACEALGSEYEPVAAGIRSGLKILLADYSDLLNSSLMDDTPAANAETQTWLRESILPPPPAPPPPAAEPEFIPAVDVDRFPHPKEPMEKKLPTSSKWP